MFLGEMARSEPLNPQTLKRSFPLEGAAVQRTGLPLKHVFVLAPPEERTRTASIHIEPLSRTALFQQLLKSSYNVEILTRERLTQQVACAARLAGSISGYRLHVPDGLHHLSLVRQRIVDHVHRTESTQRSV